MKGDCRAAAASYRAYLRTSPAERSAAPARQNLERCERELANAPPPPVPTPSVDESGGTVATATANTVTVATAAPRRRWQDDRAAPILVGLGGAALVAGGVLVGVGEAGARSLAGATSYDQFAAHARDA